jgi:hypothetical protein
MRRIFVPLRALIDSNIFVSAFLLHRGANLLTEWLTPVGTVGDRRELRRRGRQSVPAAVAMLEARVRHGHSVRFGSIDRVSGQGAACPRSR